MIHNVAKNRPLTQPIFGCFQTECFVRGHNRNVYSNDVLMPFWPMAGNPSHPAIWGGR